LSSVFERLARQNLLKKLQESVQHSADGGWEEADCPDRRSAIERLEKRYHSNDADWEF